MNTILCFLVAFCQPITFSMIGEISAGELLLPLFLCRVFSKSARSLKTKLVIKVVLLFGLYFAFLMVSDFYRATPSEDYLRGWAKLIVLGVAMFIFIGAVKQPSQNALAFIIGGACSVFLRLAVEGVEPWNSESFKWLYSEGLLVVTFIVVGLLWCRARMVAVLACMVFVAMSFLMNYRSMAGVSAMTLAVMLWSQYANRKRIRISFRKLILGILLGGGVGFGILQIYIFGASSGFFGEKAFQKFELQRTSSGEFSLLSGRSELFFALPKILESPLIGWGSWARDEVFVMNRDFELTGTRKRLSAISASEGLIPTHSHIVAGWIEAGLAGAIFWISVIWITVRNIIFLPPGGDVGWSLFVMASVLMLWDLIFSPFGGARRVEIGMLIAWQLNIALELGYKKIWSIRSRRKIPMPHGGAT